MRLAFPAAIGASLGALCLAAGCSSRTDVSMAGNVPAQYSHVWVTAQAVWFNTSATAGPDDSGWTKFPLSTPTTIDLVADNGGTLGSLATSLKLLPGSYSQVRLIPVDPAQTPLTDSAQAAGAMFNSEVDYEDSSGNTQPLPLEFLNPDKGIGIQTALRVPIGNLGSALAAGGGGGGIGTTGTNDATNSNGLLDASGGTTAGTTSTTTTPATTTTTTTSASFALNVSGTSDIVPFTITDASSKLLPGMLFSQHAAAYDLSEVGGIQGTLTLTNLTGITGVSGLPDIVASAEVLTSDGSRHVVIASAPVHSDGTFLLYPLPTNSSSPAIYDVVIHGAGIATIIIRNVTVTLSSSSTGTTATPANTLGTGTTTTGTTTTGTTTTGTTTTDTPITAESSIVTATVNAVSLGTLTPRAAGSYSVNVTPVAGSSLPAGSLVSLYETPSGEAPYVIESSPIDPFNQIFSIFSLAVSSGTIDTGTYVTSGNAITLVSGAPQEGAGNYVAAASAPGFADGTFSNKVVPPASSTTTPVTASVPTLSIASGGASGSVLASVTPPSGSKYNRGQLIVSHDGTVVSTVALDTVLTQGGGTVAAVAPAGTPNALYYVSVRVWNTATLSSTPPFNVQRQWYPTAVDLRSGTSGSIQLTIN